MGRFSADRVAYLDSLPVRALLIVLAVLLSGSARAGTVQLAYSTFNKATSSVSGSAAAANAGKFITPATVSVSGRAVSVPATASFASNAASFAVTAVRASPASLFVGLVVPWMASQALSYANNAWLKDPEDPAAVSGPSTANLRWGGYVTPLQGCTVVNSTWSGTPVQSDWNRYQCRYYNNTNAPSGVYASCTSGGGALTNLSGSASCGPASLSCPSGGVLTNGVCVTAPVAATESDFTAMGGEAMTDGVAQQLAQAGVAMPVQNPVFDPVDVPLGLPRLDPVSNRMVQDRVSIVQTDPVANPEYATATPYTVDAGAVPGQTASPAALPEYTPGEEVTGAEPAQDVQTDCDKYPEASGCKELGTPDDTVSLGTENPSMTVSPLSFGGSHASCPADKVVSVSGQSISIPYGHMCSLANWIKPILLAIAWFVAASIVAGSVRPE